MVEPRNPLLIELKAPEGIVDLQDWSKLSRYAATEVLEIDETMPVYLRAVSGDPPHVLLLRGRIRDSNSLLSFCAAATNLRADCIELEVRVPIDPSSVPQLAADLRIASRIAQVYQASNRGAPHRLPRRAPSWRTSWAASS